MSPHRRNVVTRDDAQRVALVAVVAGALAVVAGGEPTGGVVVDGALAFAVGMLVTWASATAPWWALLSSSGLALAASAPGPLLLVGAAALAVAGAFWLAVDRASRAPVRAVIGALVVQVVLRLEWDPFLGAPAIVAAVALGLLVVCGVLRRQRYVRRRALWVGAGVGGVAVLAIVGMGVAGAQARTPAVDGYRGLLLGLEYLQDGRMEEGAAALRSAAADLDDAQRHVSRPWTQPARLLPVVAQNRTVMAEVLGSAAEAASTAAATLDLVDLEQLRIVNGRVDVVAVAALEQPLADLDSTVADLRVALEDARSPWLLQPFQRRLDTARHRAAQVSHQASATTQVARHGPAILGADGQRRYLLVFTNPGESRGTSGLIGNWTELLVTDGRLQESESGRTARLISTLEESPVTLEGSEEFFDRYGPLGARRADGTVHPKYWSNVTMSPDMPTVGRSIAAMYEGATGRALDGVFVIDPAGIAGLLSVTGPIEVPELGVSLSGGNAERFLLVEQYEREESDREAVLEAVTSATVERLLTGSLPPPHELAQAMATPALEGHVTVWLAEPDEQRVIELIGMDGSLPPQTADAERPDALAIVSNNASGNKIDSFLQRTVEYRAVYDARDGRIEGEVRVVLENLAPTTGFDDYVIGNIIGLPRGTNRHLVSIYTPLEGRWATVDGQDRPFDRRRELGWNVYSTSVDVPPGGEVEVALTTVGYVSTDAYELVVRPQALPRADQLSVRVTSPDGSPVLEFEGSQGRRSVFSSAGVRAWR